MVANQDLTRVGPVGNRDSVLGVEGPVVDGPAVGISTGKVVNEAQGQDLHIIKLGRDAVDAEAVHTGAEGVVLDAQLGHTHIVDIQTERRTNGADLKAVRLIGLPVVCARAEPVPAAAGHLSNHNVTADADSGIVPVVRVRTLAGIGDAEEEANIAGVRGEGQVRLKGKVGVATVQEHLTTARAGRHERASVDDI